MQSKRGTAAIWKQWHRFNRNDIVRWLRAQQRLLKDEARKLKVLQARFGVK